MHIERLDLIIQINLKYLSLTTLRLEATKTFMLPSFNELGSWDLSLKECGLSQEHVARVGGVQELNSEHMRVYMLKNEVLCLRSCLRSHLSFKQYSLLIILTRKFLT